MWPGKWKKTDHQIRHDSDRTRKTARQDHFGQGAAVSLGTARTTSSTITFQLTNEKLLPNLHHSEREATCYPDIRSPYPSTDWIRTLSYSTIQLLLLSFCCHCCAHSSSCIKSKAQKGVTMLCSSWQNKTKLLQFNNLGPFYFVFLFLFQRWISLFYFICSK